MIRFSAALVAVAIGVLIGGIATSKLLLVYIAIVVSAVALLVLAIGVVVKREELFGEGRGLVPAGAGTAPVLPAHADESQDQSRSAASVPSPAPFQGPAAGYGAFDGTSFGGTAPAAPQAAPPVTAPPSSAANPLAAPDGPGRSRVADPVPAWEAQSARDQWASSPWPGSTAADPAPDWMAGGRGESAPVDQAGPSASSTDVSPPPPAPQPAAPSGAPSTGPAPAAQNWFAPRARSADAALPATEAPADPALADEDDDWPTRYSWLEDLDDESQSEADEADAPVAQAGGADVGDHPVPKSSGSAGWGDPEPDAGADDAPASGASAGDARASDALAETAVPSATDAGQEPAPAEQETGDPDGEQAGPAQAAGMVAVLRGVPRYHQPDCVLIRFMPETDVRLLPAEQAKADGCTPCAACQPAG